MIILMAHPQHGRTHAYEHEEVERLKKLGWAEEPVAKKPEAPEPAAVIIAGRKPGRPKKT